MNNKIFKRMEMLSGLTNTTKIDKFLKEPRRDRGKSAAIIDVPTKSSIHQADLLRLPEDNSFKYALVVVDAGNRACDAEPMKTTSSKETVRAITKIYKRKYLDEPILQIATDKGSEFKGAFKQWTDSKGIILKYGRTGRTRQQALPERYNYVISRAIQRRQLAKELITDNPSLDWVEYLPTIIKVLNEELTIEPKEITKLPHCRKEKGDCELYDEGLKVRIRLDKPIDVLTGKRLPDQKWRVGDIRWTPKIHTIKQIILRSGQPPLYRVSNIKNTVFTKSQLQPYDEAELDPKMKIPKTFNIDKFVGKKTINGKVHYKVRWKNYSASDDTYEPRTELIKDLGNSAFKKFVSMFKLNEV